MNLLQPGRSLCIQDVVEAFPECKWAEIFGAIEALNQNQTITCHVSGSTLEMRAIPHGRSKWGVPKASRVEPIS